VLFFSVFLSLRFRLPTRGHWKTKTRIICGPRVLANIGGGTMGVSRPASPEWQAVPVKKAW